MTLNRSPFPAALTIAGASALFLLTSSVAPAQAVPQSPPVLLQMIRDDAVHDDLRLTAAQRGEIMESLPTIDGRWFRARNVPADKQRAEIDAVRTQLLEQLSTLLNTQQMTRLQQLRRQALGTRMVLLDDVANALELTTEQRASFRDSFLETDSKANDIQKQLQKGEIQGNDAQRQMAKLKDNERKSLVDQLSQTQRGKLGSLTGTPFDFGKVKRMYPLAPELTAEGVTWIQGGPLSLEQLRGKVVAVHYYAFQCINCRRNLPHYKAWHDDYADKDLVIIGIQTPETAAERSLDRVTAAAKNDGIEYPVLLDSQSSNWRTWNNTMWPTVYLIDKKGFIRRWWQGEMNWQGTPGEKQMRETIEMLLAEDA